MKKLNLLIFVFATLIAFQGYSQNQKMSDFSLFDGEPFVAINPNNTSHIVIAWMGFKFGHNYVIRSKTSFDGGNSWSALSEFGHSISSYSSADPCIAFDNNNNVYISYIDFSGLHNYHPIEGSILLQKSLDGGLTWQPYTEVITTLSDSGNEPIDRPWMVIDNSTSIYSGNVYVSSMNIAGDTYPFHPYISVSNDGGNTFDWDYLDTTGWLSGSFISQPMPTPTVSSNGELHLLYPSYVLSQNVNAQYILASSKDGGNTFSYKPAIIGALNSSDSLAKKGYLLRADPSDTNHLAIFSVHDEYGDLDAFIRETFDKGDTWTSPKRINDDPISNGKVQDLIWADFDTDGDLFVSWRDRRNGTGNDFETESEIWGTYRIQGDTSFQPNFELTDTTVAYDSTLEAAGNDFMCSKIINDTIHSVWSDMANGYLNVWYRKMSAQGNTTFLKNIANTNPQISIFPNPTKDFINIEGRIKHYSIIDSDGAFIKTGNENRLNIESLPKGIYFIKILSHQNEISTLKFIVD